MGSNGHAFGDNMAPSAERTAKPLGLNAHELHDALKNLVNL